MSLFATGSLVGWLMVVLNARVVRGKLFAIFGAIVLGVHSLSAAALLGASTAWLPLFATLQVATILHFFALARPRMWTWPWRMLVSWPASIFVASSLLAIPWSVSAAIGYPLPAPYIPFVLAIIGFAQSMTTREEDVHVVVRDGHAPADEPKRHRTSETRSARPLRIVQLTDTHLGPFMSVDALARICERAVERNPDLILLTGDYLTMESQMEDSHLALALAPLAKMQGRVFACRGNHDHEAPEIVANALSLHGIPLLSDDEAVCETEAGPVQIIGADFAWRNRKARLVALADRFPRRPGHLRLWLLHHPGAFEEVPEGEADLVLSGHTHGGQVGLVSLGLRATVVSMTTRIPDHGLWARGRDRLYVHRGTGHYGFPLRLGVPAERSLVHVHADAVFTEAT
jgi:predicted MPP superfamily phosphohydrolase